MKIVYVGRKSQKGDNVAGTGLIWAPGDVHEVADAKKANQLIEHKGVWADADKPYELAKEPARAEAGLEPRVEILPTGGAMPGNWEPIRETVDKDVFQKLQSGELTLLFVTPEDADAFSAWKKRQPEKKQKQAA